MNEETQDRRSQRTRAALQTAFVQLLLKDGYDALKVGAIAEAANVGRSTLYEHYRTKQDLLRATLSTPFTTLAGLVQPGCSTEPVIGLLKHFRENQQVSRVLLSWPTRPVLGQTLAALVGERLASGHFGTPLIPSEITARQIADAQLALVECWVLGRPSCDIGTAAQSLMASTRALAVSAY
ncbi:MAG: TetR/AcrR family transcriptional regulator [Pseudomonadota bacterium]